MENEQFVNNVGNEGKSLRNDSIATFDQWMLSNSETDLANMKAKDDPGNNNNNVNIGNNINANGTIVEQRQKPIHLQASSYSSSSGSWLEPLETILSPGVSSSSSKNSTPINNTYNDTVGDNINKYNFNGNRTSNNYNALDSIQMQYHNNNIMEAKKEEEPYLFLPGLPSVPLQNYDIKQMPQNYNDINNNSLERPVNHDHGKKKKYTRKKLTEHQKEAHNKIEKRYRININNKITKLQQIIPWVANEQTSTLLDERQEQHNGNENINNIHFAQINDSTNGEAPKLNKSMILEKAVDYILYLQNNERLYELEVKRLKSELESLKNQINR